MLAGWCRLRTGTRRRSGRRCGARCWPGDARACCWRIPMRPWRPSCPGCAGMRLKRCPVSEAQATRHSCPHVQRVHFCYSGALRLRSSGERRCWRRTGRAAGGTAMRKRRRTALTRTGAFCPTLPSTPPRCHWRPPSWHAHIVLGLAIMAPCYDVLLRSAWTPMVCCDHRQITSEQLRTSAMLCLGDRIG